VQWRYSDAYVGWAPIGPGRYGYAYGAPVNYDPPVAEAWVFVQPRYLTSRAISHYALPIGALGPAFLGATTIYRPQYRGVFVYNYGMPRGVLSAQHGMENFAHKTPRESLDRIRPCRCLASNAPYDRFRSGSD
jgi:hypothetical protein